MRRWYQRRIATYTARARKGHVVLWFAGRDDVLSSVKVELTPYLVRSYLYHGRAVQLRCVKRQASELCAEWRDDKVVKISTDAGIRLIPWHRIREIQVLEDNEFVELSTDAPADWECGENVERDTWDDDDFGYGNRLYKEALK